MITTVGSHFHQVSPVTRSIVGEPVFPDGRRPVVGERAGEGLIDRDDRHRGDRHQDQRQRRERARDAGR
jgi:hypothetical protein